MSAVAPGGYRNAAAGGYRNVALWSKRDAGWLGILLGVGALFLVVAWVGASGKDDAGDQIVFVTLALLGALVGWAAAAGWVLGGRRAITARRTHLLGEAPPRPVEGARSPSLVAADGGRYFHRSDCPLAAGRNWAVSPRGAHESAGLAACPGCRP